MIYAPYGHCVNDSVLDPELVLREWHEAMRVVTNATQYQWEANSILDQDKILKGESLRIDQMKTWVDYDITTATAPDVQFGWDVPYNTNYEVVPFPDEGPADPDKANGYLKWTSKYPELVFAFFSWQYCRVEYGSGIPNTMKIRTKIRIAIDNILQRGSGPYAIPIDTKHRGAGIGVRAMRTTSIAGAILEAGTHVVSGMACQQQAQDSDSDDGAEPDEPKANQPVDDVVTIGNRRLIVVRFAQGRWMTG